VTPAQLAIIAQNLVDLNDPQTLAAAIVTVIGTFFIGIAAALYGPFISDWWARKKLRKNLYRELVNWYETAYFYIRGNDLASRNAFFKPWDPSVNPDSPPEATHVRVGRSIVQAEMDPQIWRIGLIEKLVRLKDIFDVLNANLLNDSLYAKALANEDNLQLFYQLPESYDIAQCYENFRSAFEFKLTPYDFVPRSRFLASEEARKLSILEAKLDYLRIACLTIEKSEASGGLSASLLRKMRRGQERGTMIRSIGTAETDEWLPDCGRYDKLVALRSSGLPRRWCSHCKRYAEPIVYWKPIKQFKNELCSECGNVLPTIDELSKQLLPKSRWARIWSRFQSSNGENRKEAAANALAKNYAYNKTEQLEEDNIDCLIEGGLKDSSQQVRQCAATALKNLGSRLREVNVRECPDREDLKKRADDALIELLKRDKYPNVKEAAIEAIGQLHRGDKNDIPGPVSAELRKALHYTTIRRHRGRLGRHDAAVCTRRLRMDLPLLGQQRAAASAIGFIGAPSLFRSLLYCSCHSSDARRFRKNDGVENDVSPNAPRAPINFVERSKPAIKAHKDRRLAIVKALGSFGEESVDCLITVLEDDKEHPEVRKWAAYILAAVGTKDKVREPLIRVANEESHYQELQIAAKRALKWLSPQYGELGFHRREDTGWG